jgi:hypothetical protein
MRQWASGTTAFHVTVPSLVVWLGLTGAACQDGRPGPTGIVSPPASASAVVAAPVPLSPCELAAKQRGRVPSLLAEGRLARARRVIAHADRICPASANESEAARAEVATALRDTRSARELVELGVAARLKDDRVEMQRMFDRAVARAEEAKTPFGCRVLGERQAGRDSERLLWKQ